MIEIKKLQDFKGQIGNMEFDHEIEFEIMKELIEGIDDEFYYVLNEYEAQMLRDFLTFFAKKYPYLNSNTILQVIELYISEKQEEMKNNFKLFINNMFIYDWDNDISPALWYEYEDC